MPNSQASHFQRYVGIDYSGAGTPDSRLPGLRVFEAEPNIDPYEVRFGHDWTRRELADWIASQISPTTPAIIGIDHGFSFPLAYFEKYGLKKCWPDFLTDFTTHWPTAAHGARVTDLRMTSGIVRSGDAHWRRLCEIRSRGAKSVFHFGVPGSVAHSTHAGLPWLGHIRAMSNHPIHFWPFDGWTPSQGISVIAEIYPSLWKARFPRPDLTGDQQDAYASAAWLKEQDVRGSLQDAFNPRLTAAERKQASLEGWILGVS